MIRVKNMNKTLTMLTLIAIIFSVTALVPAETLVPQEKGELILKFKMGTPSSCMHEILRAYGLTILDEVSKLNILIVSVSKNKMATIMDLLKFNPFIEFVEENIKVSATQTPNDPYYSLEWHLEKIQMPTAWDISKGDPNVVIAVLDTGVDVNHPDLAGKILEGYNAYDDSNNIVDDIGHGTMVAGTAAAITNNALGVSAPAWNCKILPIKVNIPGAASTTYSLLAKGLIYAADKGAKVACMSWQIFNGSGTLAEAAKYFVEKGGIVIAAAGNTGKYEDYMDNQYIVSVAATDQKDLAASFSSYGPYVDLSAPGVSILTTIDGKQATSYNYAYGYVSGTSFSAPLTAGLAALIYSANPSLTPNQIEQILETSAVDLGEPGYDYHYGWGRINATKALEKSITFNSNPEKPTPDTNPPTVKITYPADGATVSGKITVKVNATDDKAVSKVELYKDNKLFATKTSSPYEFTWDTTTDPNGPHTLKAKAYDTSNNTAESNLITVNVNNPTLDKSPPTVKISSPRNRALVSGTTQIKVTASDDTGIAKIEIYIDNNLVATGTATETLSFQWNTKTAKNGWHTITAKAYDLTGKTTTATISVYVYNRK
jgi:subtilisin family serine protease